MCFSTALCDTCSAPLWRSGAARNHSHDPGADEVDDREHRDGAYDRLQHPGVVLGGLPVLPEQIAGQYEREVPDQAAGEWCRRGRSHRHPLHAGRDGDQAAEERDHPAVDDRLDAVTGEPLLGLLQIGDLDERQPGGQRQRAVPADQGAEVLLHDPPTTEPRVVQKIAFSRFMSPCEAVKPASGAITSVGNGGKTNLRATAIPAPGAPSVSVMP
jgi:hypothetical protein